MAAAIRLLDDGAFRRNAQVLAAEIATGALPADAALLIEQLVTTGAPVKRPEPSYTASPSTVLYRGATGS